MRGKAGNHNTIFVGVLNKKENEVRMEKLRIRLKKKLYDKQNIDYEKINNEVERSDIINSYNDLIKKCKGQKKQILIVKVK